MALHSPRSASELLDLYYLEARCHLLETAAFFDRLDRAPGGESVKNDPRYRRLLQALQILSGADHAKAAAFLNAFSEE